LDTLALSGNKQTMPQLSPPNQTLVESVSNQRLITGVPTAQSLRTTSPNGKMQEPNLPPSVENVSKKSIPSDFPSQGSLPDPVVITKSKTQKSTTMRAPDPTVTSVKTNRRPHIAKSASATFNTRDLPGIVQCV